MKNCQLFIRYLYIKYRLSLRFNSAFKRLLNDTTTSSGMAEKSGGGVR